jgi:hypothetical protein
MPQSVSALAILVARNQEIAFVPELYESLIIGDECTARWRASLEAIGGGRMKLSGLRRWRGHGFEILSSVVDGIDTQASAWIGASFSWLGDLGRPVVFRTLAEAATWCAEPLGGIRAAQLLVEHDRLVAHFQHGSLRASVEVWRAKVIRTRPSP